MCLAVPAEIVELFENGSARVNLGGVKKMISVRMIDEVKIGDFVLVHVGHALTKVDPEEAQKTLELFQEVFGLESVRQEVEG